MAILLILLTFGVAFITVFIFHLFHDTPADNAKNSAPVQLNPGEIWWKNLKHTPLSPEESRLIADQVAMHYSAWKASHSMNHSWLCIAIDADKVEFKQVYSHYGMGQAPNSTIFFSHSLSCQQDREQLSQYILEKIRQEDSYCQLYLDGDALILPTN